MVWGVKRGCNALCKFSELDSKVQKNEYSQKRMWNLSCLRPDSLPTSSHAPLTPTLEAVHEVVHCDEGHGVPLLANELPQLLNVRRAVAVHALLYHSPTVLDRRQVGRTRGPSLENLHTLGGDILQHALSAVRGNLFWPFFFYKVKKAKIFLQRKARFNSQISKTPKSARKRIKSLRTGL